MCVCEQVSVCVCVRVSLGEVNLAGPGGGFGVHRKHGQVELHTPSATTEGLFEQGRDLLPNGMEGEAGEGEVPAERLGPGQRCVQSEEGVGRPPSLLCLPNPSLPPRQDKAPFLCCPCQCLCVFVP